MSWSGVTALQNNEINKKKQPGDSAAVTHENLEGLGKRTPPGEMAARWAKMTASLVNSKCVGKGGK